MPPPMLSRFSGSRAPSCHGLAVKSGRPGLRAECDGVPVIGPPDSPLPALGVLRLFGGPSVWRLGGSAEPHPSRRWLRREMITQCYRSVPEVVVSNSYCATR